MQFYNINKITMKTKDNWMFGGSFSISHSKVTFQNDANLSTQIITNPKVGYFLANNLAIGIVSKFGWQHEKSAFSSTRYTNFGIGPFCRYYFLPLENRTNLLIEGSSTYNIYKYSLSTTASKYLDYSLLAGPVVFLNSSVGLEILVGYNSIKEVDSKRGRISFNIGIQYHFDKN
ncbi:MAG: hypothetical protein EAZ35_09380 [Sphingobacteriia bacterium]|nr:MAG: hypothetical protein EAZ35_09380 [Sphingobacteriia bacterium]